MIARMNGWTEFISMQNFYAASYRNEEQEMLPCCKKLGVGVIPWSPLAVSQHAGGFDRALTLVGIGRIVDKASQGVRRNESRKGKDLPGATMRHGCK